MSSPASEARILAEIEAELRAGDPRLLALFDSFSRANAVDRAASRRAEWSRRTAHRALLLIALLLVAVFGVGGPALSATGASAGITGLADRATTDAQRWMSQRAHDIQAQICQSVPVLAGDDCG